MTSIRQLPFH